MARKKATPATTSVPVDAITHPGDTRSNIPTRELADFSADDKPKTVHYPRDASLDPQLVWKGKEAQNASDLAVPAVPIYVQEKIHPQAIIEDLKRQQRHKTEGVRDLFSDFNGLDDFQKKTEFYQHQQHWTNRLILGDSLLVMTSLAEKERLRGQVQCIYFDPPYGIKFGSNWQVSTRKRDVKDAKAEDLTRQPEQIKAFRDTYELGIHSYLTYIRDRLMAIRELLTESGSIFFQIGDENVHLVRCLMDEVFGSENFCSVITIVKTSGASSPTAKTLVLADVCDYVLWYCKRIDSVKYRQLFKDKESDDDDTMTRYRYIEEDNGKRRNLTQNEKNNISQAMQCGQIYRRSGASSQTRSEQSSTPFVFNGKAYAPEKNRGWSTTINGLQKLQIANRLEVEGNSLCYVRFFNDFPVSPIANVWQDVGGGVQSRADPKVYVVQTGTGPIQRCILMATDPGDLVLDPTCGSGTTAYVAEQWGRRWITIDTSRVALTLARTRLMAARYPYYLLADTKEGIHKLQEPGWGRGDKTPVDASWLNRISPPGKADVKQGFVYKTVPHVTLKSIANNPDIDTIHAAWATKLENEREALQKVFEKDPAYQRPGDPLGPLPAEWTIPRERHEKWPKATEAPLAKYWDLVQQRQLAIDAAIRKHADSEVLYDQAAEDKGIVRVCGPFTVETLSPHREFPDATGMTPETPVTTKPEPGNYLQMVFANLVKAGIKGTVKAQRMSFQNIDPYPGLYVHGQATSDTGLSVRISVGPELGTVGDKWISNAAKECIKGSGADVLLICAFAFEASVLEKTKELSQEIQFGKLTILPVKMNPDLAMFGDETGQELLKKTGTGNLFNVFGEPDLEVKKGKDGRYTVRIKGMDVFDPTTGEVRSGGTEDIACWFIDTDYDGASFFVRQAYFLGSDEPYEKLKRALKAEVDEGEWAKLYSEVSLPFSSPVEGKIAVKVINHFGDDVLKVIELG